MTHQPVDPHVTPHEVELWAEGLLGTARVMHLADCAQCLAVAPRERKLFRALAQLPRLAPEFGFADRVMARVRLPTPSDKFGA